MHDIIYMKSSLNTTPPPPLGAPSPQYERSLAHTRVWRESCACSVTKGNPVESLRSQPLMNLD